MTEPWLDHDWHEVNGVAICRNCLKDFGEVDAQEEPIICWGEEDSDE